MLHLEPHEAEGPPSAAHPVASASEGNSLAARIDALQRPTECDQESDLARRLAEVLRKPVKRASPTLTPQTTWPEELETAAATAIDTTPATIAAFAEPRDVDTDFRRLRRVHAGRAAKADPAIRVASDEVTPPDDDGGTEPEETSLPPQATVWVETARRQRTRAILKSAASWMVSVSVSVLIVAVAAWILLGRPADLEALKEQTLKALDLG